MPNSMMGNHGRVIGVGAVIFLRTPLGGVKTPQLREVFFSAFNVIQCEFALCACLHSPKCFSISPLPI